MITESLIRTLEDVRRSKVLMLAASNLEIDLLPALFEALREIGHAERLDVLLYGRGGVVNAARRTALLLREFSDRLCFIVPHYCESSATILTLGGDEIVAGPLAIFSPIDPHLQASEQQPDESPAALSSQDVRLFSEMMQDWFELEEKKAKKHAMSLLCNSIFPTTLTSFYRSTLELQEISNELLAFQLADRDKRATIIHKLLYGYHSHTYAITRDEMKAMGINIQHQPAVEAPAWTLACEIRAQLGRGACVSLEDGWNDVIIATTEGSRVRRRTPNTPAPLWQAHKKK